MKTSPKEVVKSVCVRRNMGRCGRLLRQCLAMVVLGMLGGCGSGESPPAPPEHDQGVQTIGLSQFSLDDPWQKQLKADIEAETRKHADLKVVCKDAGGDPQRQVTQVQDLTAEGANLLIVVPGEIQELTEASAKAYGRGIPVIVLHRPLIGDQYTCFLGADDEKIARAAGRWLAQQLDGKGKIGELKGPQDDSRTEERRRGFRAALKDLPGIRILFEAGTEGLQADAEKETKAALAQFDDIDAVYADNDAAAYGAYLAAKEAGRQQGIIFVGIGGLPGEGAAYVRDGSLNASFEYPTGGKQAVQLALRILAGEKVPKKTVLPSNYFTSQNVEQGGQPVE
jgi:ribose transport system substrate-binding protein